MPRYNYECSECKTVMEIMHSMSEVAEDCPSCLATNSLKKLLTIPDLNPVPKAEVGSVVKGAIEEYKERIKGERGVWGEFDISSVIGKNK